MIVAQELVPMIQGSEIGARLRAAHERWCNETETYLTPVIVPESSFWERWTAVRYMADGFLRHYRRELVLLDQLQLVVPASVSEGLSREGERIGQLQRELDRVGRRRGTAHTVSVVARELLDALRAWCADIEVATRQMPIAWAPAVQAWGMENSG
jgi:hypothetical protein